METPTFAAVSQTIESTFSLTELLTAASATATASSTQGMDGMSMSMSGMSNATTVSNMTTTPPTGQLGGMANATTTTGTNMMQGTCKVSMLWNWETIDTCFLSQSWQIHSRGAFAGLCIGVIFLVIFLEFLRWTAKTYDRHIVRAHSRSVALAASSTLALASGGGGGGVGVRLSNSASTVSGSLMPKEIQVQLTQDHEHDHDDMPILRVPTTPFRPSVTQQAVRALLHTSQFATAYWIMLMAMYYNGYVIICIFVGAFIGSFIFQWERIGPRSRADGVVVPVAVRESTGCCG